MAGRMKVMSNNIVIQEENTPVMPYEYYVQSEYDRECGTVELNQFQLPHPMCPEKFICDVPEDNEELKKFTHCLDSMDCAMMVGMTIGNKAEDEIAFFIHGMIPHHQNAVNMAKALLKSGKLNCDDVTDDENPDCVMEEITRSIIAGQNFQINQMRSVLDAKGFPYDDQCVLSSRKMLRKE